MNRLFNYIIIISVMVLSACVDPPVPEGENSPTPEPKVTYEWVDAYSLAFLRQGTSVIVLRYFEQDEWKEALGVGESNNSKFQSNSFKGVSIARELGGWDSVLGYTFDNKLFVHEGLGLAFGEFPQEPDHELGGVASSPAIVHIGNSEYLIAYTAQDGTIRLQSLNFGAGFGNQIPLTVEGNENVSSSRPAMAYYNGRLVVVWSQNDPRVFRYVAADYQPGDDAATIIAAGEIEKAESNIPDYAADPALTHDGVGQFYLSVLYRSQTDSIDENLSHAALSLLSSPDGMNWTLFNEGTPNVQDLKPGLVNIDLAAQPSGEILFAVTTTTDEGSRVGKVYQYQSGLGWTGPDLNATFKWEPGFSSFSLVRSQYQRQSGQ